MSTRTVLILFVTALLATVLAAIGLAAFVLVGVWTKDPGTATRWYQTGGLCAGIAFAGVMTCTGLWGAYELRAKRERNDG